MEGLHQSVEDGATAPTAAATERIGSMGQELLQPWL